MLLQASVGDLLSGRIQRKKDGYVVIAMKKYPRGVRIDLRDEYLRVLAPPTALFERFMKLKTALADHEEAFVACEYEKFFWLEEEGFVELRRLAEKSKNQNVYLVCQCTLGERCHRELLLLAAHRLYGAPTGRIANDYPDFEKRLVSNRDGIGEAPSL